MAAKVAFQNTLGKLSAFACRERFHFAAEFRVFVRTSKSRVALGEFPERIQPVEQTVAFPLYSPERAVPQTNLTDQSAARHLEISDDADSDIIDREHDVPCPRIRRDGGHYGRFVDLDLGHVREVLEIIFEHRFGRIAGAAVPRTRTMTKNPMKDALRACAGLDFAAPEPTMVSI